MAESFYYYKVCNNCKDSICAVGRKPDTKKYLYYCRECYPAFQAIPKDHRVPVCSVRMGLW